MLIIYYFDADKSYFFPDKYYMFWGTYLKLKCYVILLFSYYLPDTILLLC